MPDAAGRAQSGLGKRYITESPRVQPRGFSHMADGGPELTPRFPAPGDGVRAVEDALSRDILIGFDAEGIQVALPTMEIVAVPAVQVVSGDAAGGSPEAAGPGTPPARG